MNRNGLTLMEESFCQLVALGKTGVEAYSEAYSQPILPNDEKLKRKLTKKASYLSSRPDIAARIIEAKGEQKRKDRELWQMRGNDLAERIFKRVIEADKSGDLLTKDALKGIEVLAKMKGLNAPEEQVLKNGGMADDFTPRGLEGVSDADLDKIINQGEVIDIKPESEELT